MNREPGFYWVVFNKGDKPEIAQFDGVLWWFCGLDQAFSDGFHWTSDTPVNMEEPSDPEIVKELEKMIDKRCMAGEIGVNTSRAMLRVIHPEWSKGGHIPSTVSYRVGEEPSK